MPREGNLNEAPSLVRPPSLHYAWVVAGVTFVVLMASAAIRATPGVLLVPLEHEFGWTRATTSSAVSLGLLLYGLVGPFCAAVAQRVGIPRRGFQGDHYDVPEEYLGDLLAAGAQHTTSRELLRRLKAAGLRLSPEQRRQFHDQHPS